MHENMCHMLLNQFSFNDQSDGGRNVLIYGRGQLDSIIKLRSLVMHIQLHARSLKGRDS